jgi:hypothetical protein
MNEKLCEKGILFQNSLEASFKCSVDNLPCCSVWYCVQEQCFKMLSSWIRCKNNQEVISCQKE